MTGALDAKHNDKPSQTLQTWVVTQSRRHFRRKYHTPPVSETELATASHSSTLSMRPSRSRSQLTPAPAIAMLPSRAYCGGSSGPNWYACKPPA